ncbi:two-component system response regulator [Thalassospira marina]|uniref:Response regulator receiver protein n=1 Tax=Thalassospira marina TaxID=2048283 RepID=A0A2N3KYA0_9PROT|nr:EAL domain-containing protein [Thalassospira marina]PKR55541.1 response regulator receiver protein [Thalassospira marina]
MSNDEFVFLEDDESTPSPSQRKMAHGIITAWRILIVDDDADVHEITEMALDNLTFLGRPAELLHAYSAAEAASILAHEQDIAIILLDVVMETSDAGLNLVGHIRNDLEMRNVRIILRTGQPGQAPEMDAITKYDIDDYKTKTELTRNKLFTSITTALRSFERMQKLDANRAGLEKIIASSNEFLSRRGLRNFAEGVITQLSGLMDVSPEGLVCAIGEGEHLDLIDDASDTRHGQIQIIAAAGRYSDMIGMDLEELHASEISSALRECMMRKETIFRPGCVVLYLYVREGYALAAYIGAPEPISSLDQHLLEVFCGNLTLCAENIQLVEKLKRRAYVDELTNLANRTAILDAMNAVLHDPDPQPNSLILIDLQLFAEINDVLGHSYGDRLLCSVGERLSTVLPDCIVGRIAADLFAVIGRSEMLTQISMSAIFTAPFKIDHFELPIRVAAGSTDLVANGQTALDYMKQAYIALKRAKSSGFGQVTKYDPQLAAITRDRAQRLGDLQMAIERDQFECHYQPLIDFKTGRPCGMEALLRWRREDGKLVPPCDFIPLAEYSGLIRPIGDWVLREAMAMLGQIHAAGFADMRVSINVSKVQMVADNFIDSLERLIAMAPVAPQAVEIEITESACDLGIEDLEVLLSRIRKLGFSIAIDDFGTGFSSLAYLDRLPVDKLKIDRCFVTPLDNDEQNSSRIAELIIPLGHRLGMAIVAEGIETEKQAQKLREMSCDIAQGYLYGKPMPADELMTWLKNFNPV